MEAELETKVVDPGSKAKPDPAKVVDLLGASRSIGRYELIHRLGHGGMATVYLGRATGKAGFERLVAVKIIHPHLASEPQFVEMFLDEARIAARIHDPHVVAIHDVGEQDGVFYMVMEYVEGDTLASLVRQLRKDDRKRLPISAILQIATDACSGLANAHEIVDEHDRPLRLVHRDVSPHNLLVSMDGRVKVVDFGIMKAAGKRSSTLTGQLRGKLAYMSPEQAEGQPLDHRTDLFALGAVIWELLTAERLFPGNTESAILMSVLDCEIPDVRDYRDDVPEGLVALLSRALAKEPEARYASARDVLKDLRVLMRELPPEVDPRADLAEAAQRYFSARIEYVRAAAKNRGAAASHSRRMTDDELLAAAENTDVARPRLSSDDLEDTPALRQGSSVRARRLTPSGARLTPSGVHDDAEPVAVRQTHTTTATLVAPGRQWPLWILLPLFGAAIGTAIVSWPNAKPDVAAVVDDDRDPNAMQSSTPTIPDAKHDKVAARTDPPVDTPPPNIRWTFNTNPPGAIVIVDGKRYDDQPTPTEVEVPRGDDPVEVAFELSGYQTRKVRFVPARTENHTIQLFTDPEAAASTTRVKPVGPRFEARFPTVKKTSGTDPNANEPKPDKGDDRTLEDKPDFRGSAGSKGTKESASAGVP